MRSRLIQIAVSLIIEKWDGRLPEVTSDADLLFGR